jgi:hypothetical protein
MLGQRSIVCAHRALNRKGMRLLAMLANPGLVEGSHLCYTRTHYGSLGEDPKQTVGFEPRYASQSDMALTDPKKSMPGPVS